MTVLSTPPSLRVRMSAKFNDPTMDDKLEKDKIAHIEDQTTSSSDLSVDEEFTPQQGRQIIHRIDRRLVTTCGVMYCISLMDRTNLPMAAIAGMTKELKLQLGFRYVKTPFPLIT